MRPTASAGQDTIPMKAIKAAASELTPLILVLVNSTIGKKKFPNEMKTTKVIPIRKKRQGEDDIGRLETDKHRPSTL